MKHSVLAAGLAALIASVAVGCKSTPKLAFWKSDKDAEAATLAHSAPELPSEAAKQNDAATAGSSQMAGGVAPAYNPGATTASATGTYPNTTAPAFGATSTTQVASTVVPSSANLGSIGMPYDPTAVPAPKATDSGTNAYASADRYSATNSSGASSTAPAYTSSLAYGSGTSTAAAMSNPSTPSSSIYGRYSPSPTDVTTAAVNAAATTASPAAKSAMSTANSYANQYGTAAVGAAPAYPGMASATPSSADAMAAAITPYNHQDGQPASGTVAAGAAMTGSATIAGATGPTTSVATAQPYRPGGTSSYPSTDQAAFQVATRPADSTGTTSPNTAATPSTTTGTTAPASATAPADQRSTRYW